MPLNAGNESLRGHTLDSFKVSGTDTVPLTPDRMKLGGAMTDDYRMTADDMPETTRRPLRDEDMPQVLKDYLALDPEGPERAAITFVQTLVEWEEHAQANGNSALVEEMRARVTPESRHRWGDFSEAVEAIAQIPSPGFGLSVNEAVGDPDVAYYPIFNSEEGFVREQGDISEASAIVTLVNRPRLGGWKVHAAGGRYLPPEDVPHDF